MAIELPELLVIQSRSCEAEAAQTLLVAHNLTKNQRES